MVNLKEETDEVINFQVLYSSDPIIYFLKDPSTRNWWAVKVVEDWNFHGSRASDTWGVPRRFKIPYKMLIIFGIGVDLSVFRHLIQEIWRKSRIKEYPNSNLFYWWILFYHSCIFWHQWTGIFSPYILFPNFLNLCNIIWENDL